jgi:hypothetical protein
MSPFQTQLIKRLKSLAWRLSIATATFMVAFLLENLQVLELPPMVTMLIALVLGEVSKYLNRYAP